MKTARWSFGLGGLFGSAIVALPTVIFAVACGGDDTEVVPLIDSGQDRSSDTGRTDIGPDTGGKAGTGGTGGATGGSGGKGGGGGSSGAGAAGKGGAAGGRDGSSGAGGVDGGGGSSGTGGLAGNAGSGGAGGLDGSAGAGGTDGGGGLDGSAGSGGTDGGGGDADGGPPPLTIDQFEAAMAAAYCTRIEECCQLGSGRFDRPKCLATVTDFAPDRVNAHLRQYKGDSGGYPSTVAFDPIQAAQCVDLQRNRGCAEDGAEKRLIYSTCVTAVQGSVTQGGACRTALECRNPLYCRPGDGGGATCQQVAASGQPCEDPNRNSDQCVYLGIHSATSLHCSTFGGSGTCVAGLNLGGACKNDQECTSGLCSTLNGSCAATQPNYPGPLLCGFFTVPSDAGTDGD